MICVSVCSTATSKTQLQAVVIELASELVVVLCDSLASSSAALAEHGRKIGSLGVHALLVEGLSHIAFESVWVDDLLDGLASFINHGVSSGEVALLKGILSGAVADEDVVTDTALTVNHNGVIVSVVLLGSDHLTGLGSVFVNGG